MSEERIAKIVECIPGLDLDTDYTSGGLPRVESLEAITGLAEITGEERGKAWEIHQAKFDASEGDGDAPEGPGTPPEDDSEDETPKDSGTPPENPKDEIPEQKTGAPEPKKEKPKAPFTIAEGKSFTSPRGILGPGTPVTPDCLGIDEETFGNFVEKGYIDDNGS